MVGRVRLLLPKARLCREVKVRRIDLREYEDEDDDHDKQGANPVPG